MTQQILFLAYMQKFSTALDHNKLYLRNGTWERSQPNFVLVDRQRVIEHDILLQTGSVIQLGNVKSYTYY
ncbi:MAG: hypothetical protein HC769_28815 [Cyanobacteria bacterium CRU_2_1]|nr:hypothetical protein [Cyanobacteria bacterium CRU_2_1]